MKRLRHQRTIIGFLTMLAFSSSTNANDKSALEAKGLKALNPAQVAEIKVGKKIRGTHVPSGTKWVATYKTDGTKTVKFDGKIRDMKWTFENGKWCETVGKKMNCQIVTYKLKNRCYYFEEGSIEHKFTCK